MKTFQILTSLSRWFLAALFAFAAGAKIAMRNDPAESYFSNVPRLVGDEWGMTIAWAIIAAELFVAALLLWRPTSRAGAAGAALLLTGFAAYALYYRFGLGNEHGLECGCFGKIISSQLGVPTAMRNLALLVPALIVLFARKRPTVAAPAPEAFQRHAQVTAGLPGFLS